MASRVEVANLALDSLGARPIDTFDDDSDEARLVKRTFDLITRETLRAHPWNFAVTRAQLNKDATAPSWKYANRYALPGDSLRILNVDDEDPEDYPWEVEGQYIVTDLGSPIKVRYIQDVVLEPGYWDDNFVVSLAQKCAAAWSEPITKTATLTNQMIELATRSQRQARSADGQEGTVKKIDNASWIEER